MPNSIVVGDQVFIMDIDYLTGALHERVGLRSAYKDTGAENWTVGRRHEANRQHIRFGTDVLTAPDRDTLFEEDSLYDPSRMKDGRFVLSEANYRRDFFHATGAYHTFTVVGGNRASPGEARRLLADSGVFISTQDCALLGQLHRHDKMWSNGSLTDDERELVESLREPQRRLLEICTDLVEDDWHYHPESYVVSSRARRGHGWASATVLRMQREGLGFLVSATGNGWIDITPKGVAAVGHLRARDATMGTERMAEPMATGRARHVW